MGDQRKIDLQLNLKCQLLDLNVILRSFRGKYKSFGELNVKSAFIKEKSIVQWINCRTKEKVGLYLNLKCQTHPEVNFETLEVTLRSFRSNVQFLF